MGSSANGLSAAEARIRGAEGLLRQQKDTRDKAKANGNYKSATKIAATMAKSATCTTITYGLHKRI